MINVKIGGGVAKYQTLMIFMVKHRELANEFQFTYYDMPNDCAWNGGRINRSIELTEQMLATYNKYNSGFCLGFTNLVVLDVGDTVGNQLLEMVSANNPNRLHGAVLSSETLRRHIKKNYPDFKLTYSITGHPTTDQLNFEGYYRELEDKYDVIVPKYSHLDNILPLMEAGRLDGSKYEILVNDNCNVTCQFYSEHFAQISYMNGMVDEPWDTQYSKSFQIEIKPKIKPGIQKTANCVQDNLTSDYLKRFYDTGVRHFKISGRDLPDESFLYQLPTHLEQLKKIV